MKKDNFPLEKYFAVTTMMAQHTANLYPRRLATLRLTLRPDTNILNGIN